MKKPSFKKYSVLFSWIVSYGTITLIFVGISAVIFFNAAKLHRAEIDRSDQYNMDYIKATFDRILFDVRKTSTDLWMNNEISRLFRYGPELTNEQYRRLVDIINTLKVSKSSGGGHISNIGLIDLKNNRAVSTASESTLREFYNLNYEDSNLSYDRFFELFGSKVSETHFISEHKNMGAVSYKFNYLRSMDMRGSRSMDESVLIIVNDVAFLEPMNMLKKINGEEFFILGAGGAPLAVTDHELYKDVDFSKLSGNGVFEQRINNKTYIVSYRNSDDRHLVYLKMISKDKYAYGLALMQGAFYFGLALMVLFGIITVCHFIKKNYGPIFSLLQMLDSKWQSGSDDDRNEFSIIQNKISTVLESNNDMDRQLYLQNRLIRNHYFSRLLKGQESYHSDEYDAEFKYESFAVALFFLNEQEEKQRRDMFSYGQTVFIITNVMEELLSEQHIGVMFEFEGAIACIVNINPAYEATATEDIIRAVGRAEKFIEENFEITFTVSISSVFKGLFNVSVGYAEAMEVMRYKQLMFIDDVMTFREIDFMSGNTYYYPFSVEQQMINLLKTGDESQTRAFVDDVLCKNISQRNLKFDTIQHLMINIMSTINRATGETVETNDDSSFNNTHLMRDILQAKSVAEMTDILHEEIRSANALIKDSGSEKENWIKTDVLPYIEENYRELAMSASLIAEKFQVHPVYISRLFKEQMGEGLWEYISRYRLEKSKELLKMTNMTLEEISVEVGYSNPRTFSRVFKKFMKITPGKYREVN